MFIFYIFKEINFEWFPISGLALLHCQVDFFLRNGTDAATEEERAALDGQLGLGTAMQLAITGVGTCLLAPRGSQCMIHIGCSICLCPLPNVGTGRVAVPDCSLRQRWISLAL